MPGRRPAEGRHSDGAGSALPSGGGLTFAHCPVAATSAPPGQAHACIPEQAAVMAADSSGQPAKTPVSCANCVADCMLACHDGAAQKQTPDEATHQQVASPPLIPLFFLRCPSFFCVSVNTLMFPCPYICGVHIGFLLVSQLLYNLQTGISVVCPTMCSA